MPFQKASQQTMQYIYKFLNRVNVLVRKPLFTVQCLRNTKQYSITVQINSGHCEKGKWASFELSV